jgi:ribosomal small subunit protein bTHX
LRRAPGLLSCAPEFTHDRGKTMGRGDRKTRKGKIAIRSYGNVRPHATKKSSGAKTSAAAKSPAKPAVKKAVPAKKAPAKKTG